MTVGQVDLAVGRQWRCLAGCRAGRRASGVLRLQLRQFGDRIEPTPGATATIDRPARSYNCRASRARCAMTGLALGIGHRAVADRFARHGSIPKVSEAPWSSVFPIDGYAATQLLVRRPRQGMSSSMRACGQARRLNQHRIVSTMWKILRAVLQIMLPGASMSVIGVSINGHGFQQFDFAKIMKLLHLCPG